jgi:hypothetical protein
MPLNTKQFEELSNLLVELFDDDGEDLNRVVYYNLGRRLFVDFASRRDTFREVVDKLLTKTEQKGSTTALFVGVLKFFPDNKPAREIIARVLPQTMLPAPEAAEQVAAAAEGVKAVRARLVHADVRAFVRTSRADLEGLVCNLELMARYKVLHDCLHTLQMGFLRLIEGAAQKIGMDSSDDFFVYLDQLQRMLPEAEDAAAGLPDTPGERGEQLGWVLRVCAIIDTLAEAAQEGNRNTAIGAIYKLKPILRHRPSNLNALILKTSEQTPIARLVETLQRVVAASGNGQSRALTDGITALNGLIPDQKGLVAQHSDWQEISDSLWAADELLHECSANSLLGFQCLWQDLTAMVKDITASDPASEWAIKLNRAVAAFEKAVTMPMLAASVSDEARRSFNAFKTAVNYRFYSVDIKLRNLCNEIIKLGQPLRRLLEEISDERH